VLILSDYKNPEKKNNASIIQLANQAGFTTHWLSNQRPVGLHESIPTMIGNAAQHKYFVNSDDTSFDVYDERIMPSLNKILQSQPSKKMIFIHLIGTHSSYKRRYPKKFNYFKEENHRTKFKHKESLEKVNTYDNAIRCNDSIVRTIIDKVKKQETNSYVVYFSDHGDEVYDTLDFSGHNQFHGSDPMYEVPFIVWLSEKYKEMHPGFLEDPKVLERKYNLEDLYIVFQI